MIGFERKIMSTDSTFCSSSLLICKNERSITTYSSFHLLWWTASKLSGEIAAKPGTQSLGSENRYWIARADSKVSSEQHGQQIAVPFLKAKDTAVVQVIPLKPIPSQRKNLTDLPLGTNVKSSTWNPNTCFTETSPDCISFKNCRSPKHHFSPSQLTISTSARFSKQCISFCSGFCSISIVAISQHLPTVWQPTSLMCICHMLIFLFFCLLLHGRNLYR